MQLELPSTPQTSFLWEVNQWSCLNIRLSYFSTSQDYWGRRYPKSLQHILWIPGIVFFAPTVEAKSNFSLITGIYLPCPNNNTILYLVGSVTYIHTYIPNIMYKQRRNSIFQFIGTIIVLPDERNPCLSTRSSKLTGPRGPEKTKQKYLQWMNRCHIEGCYSHLHPLVLIHAF